MKIKALLPVLMILSAGCSPQDEYDASGNFEADEAIVAAEQNGELLSFPVNEGDLLQAGAVSGQIDSTIPQLQKEQVEASMKALQQKTATPDEQTALVRKQLDVQQAQLEQLQRERSRTERLVQADAATRKQLDDIDASLLQLQRQMAASRQQIRLYESNTATQNRSILSESGPMTVAARQYQEQINKGRIINPVTGIVLTKYALKGELMTVGKPLYKIANTDTLTLKAYLTGDKLAEVKTGQQVTVRIDKGAKAFKSYTGTITWIAAKSEFTPKAIQTKDERANLVYAIKVRVKNDGYLKIGMYGAVLWHEEK